MCFTVLSQTPGVDANTTRRFGDVAGRCGQGRKGDWVCGLTAGFGLETNTYTGWTVCTEDDLWPEKVEGTTNRILKGPSGSFLDING